MKGWGLGVGGWIKEFVLEMELGDMVVGGTHYYVYIGGMAEDRFFSNVLPPTAYPPPSVRRLHKATRPLHRAIRPAPGLSHPPNIYPVVVYIYIIYSISTTGKCLGYISKVNYQSYKSKCLKLELVKELRHVVLHWN